MIGRGQRRFIGGQVPVGGSIGPVAIGGTVAPVAVVPVAFTGGDLPPLTRPSAPHRQHPHQRGSDQQRLPEQGKSAGRCGAVQGQLHQRVGDEPAAGQPSLELSPQRRTATIGPRLRPGSLFWGMSICFSNSSRRSYRLFGEWQHGHRGKRLTIASISLWRMVAIEFGMWRSGRKGGSPGSVTVGYCKFREQSGATRS